MDSHWIKKVRKTRKLAFEIAQGKTGSERAEKILKLSRGLDNYLEELEEALAAIADDLSPRLLAPFIEYIHIDRARALALAAGKRILPKQAEVNKNKFLAFKELQRIVQQHVNDGHDRDGELYRALENVIAGKLKTGQEKKI